MIRIDINQKVGKTITKPFFTKWLKKILLVANFKGSYEISVAIVGSQSMKKINYQSRGKNQPTNVLSFAEVDVKNKKFIQSDGGYLGEVVICYPIAVKQAKTSKIKVEDEVARLFVHGMLHLLGYDHIKDSQAVVMEKIEDKVLGGWIA